MKFERPFTHKTDFMRQLIKLVSKGYFYYVEGNIQINKIAPFFMKMHEKYGVFNTNQQRYRKKLKGICSTKLLSWVNESKDTLFWVLVCTEGEGDVKKSEDLKDFRNKKTRFKMTGYEMVQLSRVGLPPSWTWRMYETDKYSLQARIRDVIIRKNNRQMNKLIQSLVKAPGFRGVRSDVYELKKFAVSEWKRIRKDNTECPFSSIFKGYLGKYKAGERYPVSLSDKGA